MSFPLSKTLRLYAVSDCGGSLESIEQAVRSGVTFLQLREKELPHEAFLAKAKAIRSFCPPKIPFIVNDDIDIAIACGADGAHIGQSDGSVIEARRRLGPGKILGVSASTVEEAVAAERDGADYLGVGAVFPTSTKADADSVSPSALRAICASVHIPVVAIGGISLANLGMLAGTGIAGVALVSAIFGAADLPAAVRSLDAATRALVTTPVLPRRGAIVDLDGVVLDSLGIWSELDAKFIARHGLAGRQDILDRLAKSASAMDGAIYLHDECGVQMSPEDICKDFHDLLEDAYLHTLPLMPGTRESLQRLRDEGVHMVLVTASPEQLVIPALRRNGVADYFEGFLFLADKTCPSTFYRALELLGTAPATTFVYDDLDSIRATAASLGFSTAAALPV